MPFHSIALRVLSSYLQVSSLTSRFELILPESVQVVVEFEGTASALGDQALSFDCAAGTTRGTELFLLKQVISMILPLAASFIICICWFAAKVMRLVKHPYDMMVSTICILYYLFFPTIVKRIAISFACTGYGGVDGNEVRYLMDNAMAVKCFESKHLAHIVGVILPGALFYLCVVPLAIARTLVTLVKLGKLYPGSKRYNPRYTYRFGFLFSGYEPKYAWWEFIVLMRKALFVILTIFFASEGAGAQVSAAVLILIGALSAQLHCSPYGDIDHDTLESASLHMSLIVLPTALLCNSLGEKDGQLELLESIVFIVVFFSSTIFFFKLVIQTTLHANHHDKTSKLGKIARATRIKPGRRKTIRMQNERMKRSLRTTAQRRNSLSSSLVKEAVIMDKSLKHVETSLSEVNDANALREEQRMQAKFRLQKRLRARGGSKSARDAAQIQAGGESGKSTTPMLRPRTKALIKLMIRDRQVQS